MRCSRSIAVLAVTLAVIAAGCGDDEGAKSVVDDDATGVGVKSSKPAPESVTFYFPKAIDTFDPHTTLSEDGAQQFMLFVYDNLVRRDLDGNISAGVAEKWEVTPTTGVFTIRDGQSCSDGTPLTAEVVARSMERFQKDGSGKARVFGPDGPKSITADPANRTVTIELNGPNNDMLTGLANAAQIVCPKGLDDTSSMKTGAPAGSGVYDLQPGYMKDDQYVLERRDDYVNLPEGTKLTDIPKLITMKFIVEDATTADLLEQTPNSIGGILSTDVTRLKENPDLVPVPAQAYGTNAVVFNQADGQVFDDVALRKAVAMLIDSEQGGAAETQGLGKPIRSLYTDNIDCYDDKSSDSTPAYDPAAGKAALDAAGYTAGADGKRRRPDGSALQLRIVGDETQFDAPNYIAEALQDAGFDVLLQKGTRAESYQKFFQGDWDLGSYPFISSTPLPALYYNQLTGTGLLDNLSKVDNPAYVEAAKQAWAAAPDSDERCAKWQEAERALLSNADAVPLDQPIKYWFGNGVTFNARYYKVDPFSIRSV